MSNVSYVRHSLAGAVVLWIDDRPNEEAIAACEDPAYVFSACPIPKSGYLVLIN